MKFVDLLLRYLSMKKTEEDSTGSPDEISESAGDDRELSSPRNESPETKRRSVESKPAARLEVEKEWETFFAEAGTSLWRLLAKLEDPALEPHRDLLRGIRHHVRSLDDAFRRLGLEIIDHTGGVFDDGFALSVLMTQPEEGIERETVRETVKPTLYFRDAPIQRGEVIIATPIRKDSHESEMDSEKSTED